MGQWEAESARQREFDDKLLALVQEYRDAIGPSLDPDERNPHDGSLEICDHPPHSDCLCGVPDELMMTEWVFVGQWTSLGSGGESYTSMRNAPSMLRSHKVGLLRTHLKALERE